LSNGLAKLRWACGRIAPRLGWQWAQKDGCAQRTGAHAWPKPTSKNIKNKLGRQVNIYKLLSIKILKSCMFCISCKLFLVTQKTSQYNKIIMVLKTVALLSGRLHLTCRKWPKEHYVFTLLHVLYTSSGRTMVKHHPKYQQSTGHVSSIPCVF
jgi:FtsH-binding integral membrane protein